ncbi:MFS transporter [Trinickia caryophylli]|uniref:Drug resistance transporter, EmrB/QacA subfamily n=1 Tax=Trinickia caryophylli TaxID=28094 RepID=A0A1X7GAX0_TRICW|nr:MFS transporter [Trinickia caryophylli]PMS11367.1 MFS transporter [Trinickia caryophylli]TRX17561.1 MFS transporter [Trinickia caryophylli]WQE11689.1 MFS transporter [Trinickia caryophylli]SMF66491.1 drug resistance transporter, EmrB/QacA subfamily [Trinickia caryophylli]GLU34875.1 MFS transporter [Trinickia caryophylli]
MTDCAIKTPYRADSTTRRESLRRRLTLALVASGMFMAVLDTTIVNVALPALRTHLGASVAELAWIVDAYTLTFAALILAGGVASDRLGAKTVYLAGLALFVAASAACGAAPDVAVLVAARFVQGAGAALFLPASLAVVRATFDDPGARARAIAIWATIASVAASVGPLVGGFLVDGLGWRSAFLMNVPTGGLAVVGTWYLVRAHTPLRARRFDWPGQLTSAVSLAALCFAAIELPARGARSPEVLAAFALAAAAAALLVFVERRSPEPMVPTAWFRNSVLVAMNAAGSLAYVGYFGLLFVLSLYLQGELGFSARETGLALLPMAASLSLGNIISGKLHGRFKAAQMMTAGLAVAAIGVPLMVALFEMHAPHLLVYGAMVMYGAGTAVSVPPMIAAVLEQVPSEQAGVASGLLNALRQTGGLIGVALAGAATALAPRLSVSLAVVGGLSCVAYAAAAWLAAASSSR